MREQGRLIEIRGTVQGVGFRPWVYRLAREQGVRGRVRNDSRGVTIEAFGPDELLDVFVNRLQDALPPAAELKDLRWRAIPLELVTEFEIVKSESASERTVSIPPDLATCADCAREIFDSSDRRFGYPFTNCTNCGPRFTIARDMPYDRPSTTMAEFTMCPACQAEYDSAEDRRFHAQPNACPVCGPRLVAMNPAGAVLDSGDPIAFGARAVGAGLIVAVKGIGGFHLACDATSSQAVIRLRERKKRDEKPFAVMVESLEHAERIAHLSEVEKKILSSVERPIVLARRRADSVLSEEVAPDNKLVGLLLPYTPLHRLFLAEAARPLVMTSGNLAEEPIARTNGEALEKLREIADLFLVHDREIESRNDDSVSRVIAGKPVVLRRARGYVPRSIHAWRAFDRPVLACGAHLKNTFCLGQGDSAFLGPHIGDLENLETFTGYEQAIDRMKRFLRIEPAVVGHDLHPDYLSTRYADKLEGVQRVGVQHHHAHVASLMAEHGLEGPVIGVAFDGTGLGTDGAAWGGEFLIADYEGFERIATFRPIALAGGDTAIRQVWRLALALLDDAYDGEAPLHAIELFRDIPRRGIDVVRKMIGRKFNSPMAHGMGRYFDAIGAMVLNRSHSTYEGQVALALNMAADTDETGLYPVVIREGESPWRIDPRSMTRAIVDDTIAGRSAATIAAKFHNTIAGVTAELIRDFSRKCGSIPAVLTGGCFQNALLTEKIVDLIGRDVRLFLHERVPPGDGGIALGQAFVADAVARAGKTRTVEYNLVSRRSEVDFSVAGADVATRAREQRLSDRDGEKAQESAGVPAAAGVEPKSGDRR